MTEQRFLRIDTPKSWGPSKPIIYTEIDGEVKGRTHFTGDWQDSSCGPGLEEVIGFYVDDTEEVPWSYEWITKEDVDAILRAG